MAMLSGGFETSVAGQAFCKTSVTYRGTILDATHRLAQANANSLVRFDRNSYSMPTKFAYRQITIVATIDEVRISFEDQLIARHKRPARLADFDSLNLNCHFDNTDYP